jgi:predicted deacylase
VQRKAMLEAMEAWNSDFHFFYTSDGNYLPNEAERQGKIVVTTELGGSSRIPVEVQDMSWNGLTNVLRHFGVLEGKVITRASLGLPPATLVDCRFDDGRVGAVGSGLFDNIIAPVSGLFEVMVEPGSGVADGQPVGRIWSHDDPTRPPLDLRSPFAGYLMGLRTLPVVETRAEPRADRPPDRAQRPARRGLSRCGATGNLVGKSGVGRIRSEWWS